MSTGNWLTTTVERSPYLSSNFSSRLVAGTSPNFAFVSCRKGVLPREPAVHVCTWDTHVSDLIKEHDGGAVKRLGRRLAGGCSLAWTPT